MKEYDGMSLAQLANAMLVTREAMDEAKKAESAAREHWEYLRKVALPNKMEEMDIDSVKISGVGRLSTRTDAYCSTPAANRELLFDWLKANGFADLITDTVNGSTLKAFVKEQILAGNDVPGEDIIKYEPYTYVAITKA